MWGRLKPRTVHAKWHVSDKKQAQRTYVEYVCKYTYNAYKYISRFFWLFAFIMIESEIKTYFLYLNNADHFILMWLMGYINIV